MIPQILAEADSPKIIDHLQSLDHDSRRLRFGHVMSDDAIRQYVQSSFTQEDYIWYGYIDSGVCIGAVHVAIVGKVAELGISIAGEWRGRKLSNRLFQRAITYLKANRISTVEMQCLSENRAIQHLARKFGMHIVTLGPGEKSASITLDPAESSIAQLGDLAFDTISVVDASIRNQLWLFSTITSIFNINKETT